MDAAEATLVPTIGDNSGNVPLREILAETHAAIAAQVDELHELAAGAPKAIRGEDDLGLIGDIVKQAVAVTKNIEASRVAAKEPYLKAGREVDAFFKLLVERITAIEKPLRQMATDYQREKAAEERRRLEEKARQQREEETRQREIARQAEEANRRAAASKAETAAGLAAARAAENESAAAAPAAELTRHRSAGGTIITTETRWTFEIVDLDAVPLERIRPYLTRADIEKAVRSFVRVGGRELPGVRIYPDETAAFR